MMSCLEIWEVFLLFQMQKYVQSQMTKRQAAISPLMLRKEAAWL